jgi:RNA polymerase sigma-70 factor (ECF subfamily)
LSVPQTSNSDGHRAAARAHHGPPGAALSEGDLLDEYLRRTAAGDRIAFQALYDLLSPYVRDSAACLFGHGDKANSMTNSVFVDVWHLADQYQSGGDGVRAWVANVAGKHTMSRYRPATGSGICG